MKAGHEEAEKSLLLTYELLSSISEGSSDAIYVKDIKGRYLLFNKEAARVTGKKAEEVIGKDDFFLFPADEAKAVMDGDRKVIENGHVMTYEEVVTTTRGTVTYLSTKGPVHDDNGEIIGLFGVARDITERKRMEDALKASEARLELVIASAELATWDWNIKTGSVIFNERWAGMRGYKLEEIQQHVSEWEKGIHSGDLFALHSTLTEHFENRIPIFQAEYRVRTRSGAWIWILDRGTVIDRDSEGKPLRMVGIEIDITDRKTAEEELRKVEGKYRLLYESMTDAYASVDMYGKITGYNNVFREMLGYTDDEMYGLSYSHITPDKWHAFEAGIIEGQVLKKGSSDVYVKEYCRKDGTVFPVELRTFLIRDKDGDPSGMCAIVRDISEREKIEKEREKLIFELQDALAKVKQLSGMLPICASCKKIRDDKGYWSQIEVYIRDHSEAEFSHGLCPDCLKKAYEELEGFKKKYER